MTVYVRRDKDIYATDGGWYQARWHFSFGHYHHPAQMGVGALRVFNDDRLQPGAVWRLHPHQASKAAHMSWRGCSRTRTRSATTASWSRERPR
jgi:redox-sensitive bicupin YhaK (pirin superfamily)